MTRPRPTPRMVLGAGIFWVIFPTTTIVWGLWIGTAGWLFPVAWRYRMARTWCFLQVWALRALCGLRWRVEGLEHVPDEPVIFFSKHQSTWETMALVTFLPPHVHVLKRELMKLPFFGWGLAAVRPIAIDRSAGRVAVEQMAAQGRAQLASGRCVMIFPEGTRVLPGRTERYRMGGAILASETGRPVVPIAHNAGEYWPRHSFLKWPGEIRVVIGEPIETAGRPPEEINAAAREFIEGAMGRIGGAGAAEAPGERGA